MKGAHGLFLAIGLGVAGALFNFAYLATRSADVDKVAFVGISPDADVARGQRLTEEVLMRVDVPRLWVGNLDDVAVLYSARQSVVGSRVWRPQLRDRSFCGRTYIPRPRN